MTARHGSVLKTTEGYSESCQVFKLGIFVGLGGGGSGVTGRGKGSLISTFACFVAAAAAAAAAGV